ncbi:leucyl aminopeptidase family protein [Cohnella cholangitidis]|uniref:Probable cytosol aminopeptidase n=1 Tax=Cohnella cholangitidis TaxID=2598458 RepID=A0A7G5C1E7_9BACL|nr:leucyl aminopeptidase family protein [Cohnella cholangitidis]QMV43031.1 leucyl aminopeptidase family protein [Cohnella cholangitidis]
MVFPARADERHFLLVGLGSKADFDLEAFRQAAGEAARAVRKTLNRSAEISFAPWQGQTIDNADALAAAWVEGWLLGLYSFDRYRKRPSGPDPEWLHLGCDISGEEVLREVRVRAEATMLARDLVNEPAGRLNPTTFVEWIQARFGSYAVRINVYQGAELEAKQMRGLLAVGKGSMHSPALVEIAYESAEGEPFIALVGKGVTFDLGGMNVKIGKDISDARMDMGGAAAVLGAMDLLIRRQARRNVVALLAIAENVPDARAYLPSDIISYSNGMNVQVKNTDAEGRLVLADALLYSATFEPREIIDIATLTGNVGEALGLGIAGMWGDSDMTARLKAVGASSGDLVWPMPLLKDYETQLMSDYADIANWAPTPYGGAGLAALFLRRFVRDKVPWVHIDMANTVQVHNTRGYCPVGATGYGVRLLSDYILSGNRFSDQEPKLETMAK